MAQTIPCPACGTDNSPDAVRCHVCDYELRARLPGPPTGVSKCPRCGSGIAGGASFCQVCGQGVEQRHVRPHTGALNVRAMFGDQLDEGDVPTRTPIREHTEIAPSAGHPTFAPPGSYSQPQPAAPVSQTREPSAPRGRRRSAPRPRPNYAGFGAGDSSSGGQLPAAPTPGYASQVPPSSPSAAARTPDSQGDSFAPVYSHAPARPHAAPRPQAHLAGDPAASASNLPRPRARVEGRAEPSSQAGELRPRTGYGYGEAAAAATAPARGDAQAWASPHASTEVRLVLVGRDGREGESFPVSAQGVEIGRHGAVAFPSDPFVSPQHAQVTPVEGGVHLADLKSRNGVYLRLTEAAAVYPGDHFLLGNQLLRLDRLEAGWQEQPLDAHEVRGFGTPAKPPWAALMRVCVGEIEDDRYHLRGTEMTIGREQGEIVFPSDGFLSRAHARVRMEVRDNAMTVVLEDLGSANGTYLRVRGAVSVPYNAMFRIGDQIFRVRHD